MARWRFNDWKWGRVGLSVVCLISVASAAPLSDKVLEFSKAEGWSVTAKKLELFTLQAYERREFDQARLSYDYSVFAALLATTDLGANVAHFIEKCVRNRSFVQQFVAAIDEKDRPQQVLERLQVIDQLDPDWLQDFSALALAIAVVHDQAPPKRWPHHQTGLAKGRNGQLQPATQVYAYFKRSHELGHLTVDLTELRVRELKYVVDLHAGFVDFEWAAQSKRVSLSRIGELYQGIAYRHDRIDQKQYHWLLPDYRLPTIQAEGGICVDQAYFTTQICKSKGIPSVQISGAGTDGYHAWVGYRNERNWDFEVGRYGGEANYVAGKFYDPQTWEQQSDHALFYATQNFFLTENYQWARFHRNLAALFLRHKKLVVAGRAIDASLQLEKKCMDTWDLKIAILEAQAAVPEHRIEAYQSARRALTRFEEVRDRFARQWVAYLEALGRQEAAQKLRLSIARDQGETRPDLAIAAIAEPFLEQLEQQGAKDTFSALRKLISRYESQPTYLCRWLLGPYVERCLKDSEWTLAERAMELLVSRYVINYNSQVDQQLRVWQARVDEAQARAP